mmetsp:Transcript_107851/g.300713  ORF Transcript_107851/g.300713 Transcript_107851/m.300713 type:complete len:270 (+) Transcript_107851:463-1272(+)
MTRPWIVRDIVKRCPGSNRAGRNVSINSLREQSATLPAGRFTTLRPIITSTCSKATTIAATAHVRSTSGRAAASRRTGGHALHDDGDGRDGRQCREGRRRPCGRVPRRQRRSRTGRHHRSSLCASPALVRLLGEVGGDSLHQGPIGMARALGALAGPRAMRDGSFGAPASRKTRLTSETSSPLSAPDAWATASREPSRCSITRSSAGRAAAGISAVGPGRATSTARRTAVARSPDARPAPATARSTLSRSMTMAHAMGPQPAQTTFRMA